MGVGQSSSGIYFNGCTFNVGGGAVVGREWDEEARGGVGWGGATNLPASIPTCKWVPLLYSIVGAA